MTWSRFRKLRKIAPWIKAGSHARSQLRIAVRSFKSRTRKKGRIVERIANHGDLSMTHRGCVTKCQESDEIPSTSLAARNCSILISDDALRDQIRFRSCFRNYAIDRHRSQTDNGGQNESTRRGRTRGCVFTRRRRPKPPLAVALSLGFMANATKVGNATL